MHARVLRRRSEVWLVALLGIGSRASFAQDRAAHEHPAAPPERSEDRSESESSPDAPSSHPPEAATELTPPRLIKTIQAPYPAEASERRVEADVVLALTIDSSGRVTRATTERITLRSQPPTSSSASETERTESGASNDPALEEAFTRAAEQAGLGFEFAPAKRGDTPVAARVRYLYEFRLPPEEEGPEAAAIPAITTIAITPAATPEDDASEDPVAPKVHEVDVKGRSAAQELEESAEAVKVVVTEEVRKESADMGEILSRTPGVSVRRLGGLGKGSRISLNGFGGDQVRIFVDGVPLEFSGYPMDIADFPVNLVERVEIYTGVVPVRFGRDALGGVINVVTIQGRRSNASASYQLGAFDTQRATMRAYYRHAPSGFFAGSSNAYDSSKNDYLIDVEVPNDVGRLQPYRVHRFNDEYRSFSTNAEAGWMSRPWADQLSARFFFTDTEQGIQNRGDRTIPYSSARASENTLGGSLTYSQHFDERWSLDVVSGYTFTRSHLVDLDPCLYNWFDNCIRVLLPGELERGKPSDTTTPWHSAFLRSQVSWQFLTNHGLLLALSPDYATRGYTENRAQTTPQPFMRNQVLSFVGGLEYKSTFFDTKLENIAFLKQSVQWALYDEDADENVAVRLVTHENTSVAPPGFGDGVRFKFNEWLFAKASYEFATRMPTAEELFGDGVLVLPSPSLEPEQRHALNVGVQANAATGSGLWRGKIDGFYREIHDLVLQLAVGNTRYVVSQNVYSARSIGAELTVGWTAPTNWLVIDLNGTYQDYRNVSTEGLLVDYAGQRIPNTPWLFANASARLQQQDVFAPKDKIALTSYLRYVHGYWLGWEDIGLPETKLSIPSYLVPSLGLVYTIESQRTRFSSSIEVQNFTDTRVVDVYGLQRPGRAFYAKITVDYF